MKKLLYMIAAALLIAGCSEDREHILKVYNWGDYIDEELIDEFEVWYEEQTGEPVEIIYQTFDINETMLSKIELGHEDYDVVCPSDYIIERMLANDLLLPLERDFGETPDYTGNMAPFIYDKLAEVQGNGKNANDYCVGYMWGTVGLIYNPKYIPEEETKSWDVLKNPAYKGKILMKDAFRDVYTTMHISLNREAIEAGEKDLKTLTFDTSAESIERVENYLLSFKESVCGWEADFGKEQMTKELAWINLSWSGDAQWAIDEAADIGMELKYAIPESGSSVWFDGWVIPKYAQNTKAARYFINFMCKPENALRNMDMTGYVSVIGDRQILEAMSDSTEYAPIDASYFFGPEADSAYVNPVMYPDRKVIERCGMMHDGGTEDLLKMWSRIKGDSASAWTYILICIVFAGLIFAVIYKYTKKRYRRRRYAKRRRR
ncbi:MAG: ABC transporter substrate-binding protein [Bacteroidales bacterium]|jgi:spermidine/putrescine transport system substrate-binding protein|nr:ABC transporter substrate-binding protein [Bacteroidales bacterium]